MDERIEAALEKARVAWDGFKSTVQTLCLWLMAVGALALVIHSWILLSNGKQREAVGALISVVLGGAGAVIWVEQWLAAILAALALLGAAWGRADRAACARQAGSFAAMAALWWAVLRWGAPIALGFGIPDPGLETTLMWSAFGLVLVNHVVRAPSRVRMTWLTISTPKAEPSGLPPIGGAKF